MLAADRAPVHYLGSAGLSRGPLLGLHGAVEAIDELSRQLYALRAQLAGEVRQDEGIRMACLDAKHGPIRHAGGAS